MMISPRSRAGTGELATSMVGVPRWRVLAVGVALAAVMLALAVKSARLQLVLGDDLQELAEDQYLRQVKLTAPRGDILDRDGRPLAVSVPAWSVVVRPHLVEDKSAAATALAAALGL